MKELEELSKKGWRFAVWLIPGGGCVIQGAKNDSEDWDIDIAGKSFFDTVDRVLLAVTKFDARAALAQPVQCTACGHKWETAQAIVTYCPECGESHHIGGEG